MGTGGNATRGLIGGGDAGAASNVIEYITIATPGNGTDFGDLSSGGRNALAACNNDARVVFLGGLLSGSNTNTCDYVNIETPGNAVDFGDIQTSRRYVSNGISGD